MKYTIYKITNIINGKVYIGKHQTMNPTDDYFGSGKAIKQAIKKYGKKNFNKEVLFIFDSEEEMNVMERKLITEDVVNDPTSYNIGVGGEGGPHFKGKKHSEESIQLMINNRKHFHHTEESKLKISKANVKTNISRSKKVSIARKKRIAEHGHHLTGRCWIHHKDLNKQTLVPKEEFYKFELNGWTKGILPR